MTAASVNNRIKKRFKKKFGKKITTSEINSIWDLWLEEQVIKPLLRGGETKLDKFNSIEVVGSSLWKDKNFVDRLVNKKGFLRVEHLNPKRKDIKYAIVFKNSLAKKPLYFDATQKLKNRVHQTLCTTNTYFSIQ